MKNIFVYRIDSSFRDLGQKGFFIEDEESGDITAILDSEDFDPEEIADYLEDVVLNITCGHNYRDRLKYDGDRREFHSFVDGYFGRPLVPAEAFLLRRLNKKEIGDLEKALDRAEAQM